jgi:glycosyltransferase involved in cell wall biosynthesis
VSATPNGLSACIITRNEAERIERCIAGVSFCDEVIVVDSHSSDGTRELAARQGARVIERDWPGYRSQKQYATDVAQHEWVLCVDADEWVTPALRAEILALKARGFPGVSGYSVPRLT